MIIEGRLKGSVDQVDAMLHFEASAEEAVSFAAHCKLVLGAELRSQDMFDAQITNICLGVQNIIETMEAQGVQMAV